MGKNWGFLKHFEESGEKGRVKCLYCTTHMKSDRSHNLKKHLLRAHGIDCLTTTKKYKSMYLQNEMGKTRRSTKRDIAFCNNSIKIELSQTQLIRAYIGLVAEDNIPFHILNSKNFKEIIDPICTSLSEKTGKAIKLNSANCEATINLVADIVRDGIKSLIKHRFLTIKIESGDNILSNKNTFFISTQFIYNDEIKSFMLGVIELKGGVGENLTEEIGKTLQKYDIKLEHVILATTNYNTQLCERKNEAAKDSANNDLDLSYNNTGFQRTDQLRIGDNEIMACAASIAQQCAMDIINDDQTENHLQECRQLTKYIRETTNSYDDIFEMQNLKFPQLHNPTSWCTTYAIISELLAAKEIFQGIKSYKSELTNEKIEVDDTLWDFMDSYCTVFSPLYKALQKFEEEHMHIGNFYAQWLKCQILTERLFEKCANTDNSFRYKLGERLVERIKSITQTLLTQDNFNACLYMDPRFQHTLDALQRQQAIAYLKRIWDKLDNSSAGPVKVEPNMEIESAEQNDFSDAEDELLNIFLSQELKMAQNNNLNIYSKIENLKLPYLRSDANVLQFWKDRKDLDADLYVLSNICFGIPATQVSIEREVPSLSMLLANHENGLELETLENILLVKLNPQYLDEAIEQLPLFECEAMEEDD